MTYNGWKNYETWCIGLWLDNDQGLYDAVRELVADYRSSERHELAGALREFIDEMPEVTAVTEHASFVSDLLGAALSEVDWYELAEHYIDESDDESDDDESEAS